MDGERERDAWIVEHIMGWSDIRTIAPNGEQQLIGRHPTRGVGTVLRFHTDRAAAWRVVDAMRAKGFRFGFYDQSPTGWHMATFFDTREYGAAMGAATDAEAICRAARAALEATNVN